MDRLRAHAVVATIHRRIAERRRLVAAALTGVAVVCGLSAARPAAAPTQAIWVADRDLSGGQPLTASEVRLERMPVADVPAGAVRADRSVAGRLLAAPVRRGEPLTDVRFLSPTLLSAGGAPGDVAVPVRVADGPAALALVRTGDLVDVIGAANADPTAGTSAEDPGGYTVVRAVRVLSIPRAAGSVPSSSDGDSEAGLLIVEASPRQAAALARAASTAQLSVAVRPMP
jgi:Flp pilus assembly protein CpaB